MTKRIWIVGLVLGLAERALAADLCIALNGTETVVGKSFKVPKKNTCRPFVGFEERNGSYAATVTGDGCVAADGQAMGLDLVAVHPAIPAGVITLNKLDERIAINVSLPLDSGAQVSEASLYDANGALQLFGVQVLPCVPSRRDVPSIISHFPS